MIPGFLIRWKNAPAFPAIPARYGVPMAAAFLALCQILPAARLGFEFATYVTILLTVWSSPHVRSLLSALPRLHRRLIIGFLVLMVAGQMYDKPGKMYPFVSWTMYSNATVSVQNLHRVKARLTDGRIVDVPLNPFPIYTLNCATAMRRLSDRAADPSGKDPVAARKNLSDFETAVATAYESLNPGHRVVSLILEETPFDIGDFRGAESLSWSLRYESPNLR